MPDNHNRRGSTSVTLMVSNDQNAALEAVARQERRTRSFIVREAIDEYLARRAATVASD